MDRRSGSISQEVVFTMLLMLLWLTTSSPLLMAEQGVILLPPVTQENADPAKATALFRDYLLLVQESNCFLPYEDVLALLSKAQCGEPTASLGQLKSCLEGQGHVVQMFTLNIYDEQIQLTTNDQNVFADLPSLTKHLVEKACGISSETLAQHGHAAVVAVEEMDFDAYLLTGKSGRIEDALRVQLHFEDDSVVFFDVETEEEIPLYLDELIKVQGQKPIELITRGEVFYLQVLENKAAYIEKLEKLDD